MLKSTRLNSLAVVCVLLLCVQKSSTVLHDLADAIAFNNVDLANFEYFKNLASKNPATAPQANLLLEHFQKKKAVLDYFEHLFFGLSPFTQESEIVFDPHFGHAWRPYFERKYGKKGRHLVEMLGHGYSLQELRRQGAIPKEFGKGYYPTR